MNRLKIAFIHNYYIHYRVPLFEALVQKYNVFFFFDAIHPYVTRISGKVNFKVPRSLHAFNETVPLLLWYYLIKGKFRLFVAGDATRLSTIMAYVVSRLLRKPYVLWEERWVFSAGFRNNLKWPIVRLISLNADAIIVPGSKSKEFYEKLGISINRVFIAPNASYAETSRTSTIKAQELKDTIGSDEKIIILYLGRVTKIKQVHILLKAFAQLCNNNQNNLCLIIAGEANREYKVELDNLSKDFRLCNVYFAGFVNENEKGSYLQLADIVVYPSVLEVWGLVINEAMFAGKPVISTTSSGGACDLIEDKVNGYLIPPGNVEVLYDRLKRLLDNPKLIKTFGEAARKTIEQGFTYSHMLSGFEKALRYALDNT